MSDKVMFMQGNEAIVRGAIAAGANFYAGYPITPSSEIAEKASELLPLCGGVYMQMEDELSSMTAVEGSTLAGARSFTATSGLGFSMMQEHIGHAVMCEVPCVIVDVQRGGPATGLATKPAQGDVMQARWGTNSDHSIITLAPASVEECYELAIKAFHLAYRFRTPVIILSDASVAHMVENVRLRTPKPEELPASRDPQCDPSEYLPHRFDPDHPATLAAFGSKYIYHMVSSTHDETGLAKTTPDVSDRLVHYLWDKIENHAEEIAYTKEYEMEDAEIVLISFGCSARSARGAMEKLLAQGVKAGVLQLQTIWPFPVKAVQKALAQAKLAVVPELNLGQLYSEVQRYNVEGRKVISVTKVRGELITPDEIIKAIEEVK